MAFTAKIADLIAEDTTGLLAKHESWERVPLSEVASILNGAPFDSAMFNTTSGIPLARIRDVMAGRTSTYYTGKYEDAYLLGQGDFLVGMDGDFNTGYWGEQVALLNQRVCKITPTYEFYDKALLGYVLPGYLAAINANTPSITVKHLSSKTIGEIELPLPPRAEQTRIVEKLEELLSDLDAGVAELKTAQRKLVQYRQSLLKAAVEGALTADWRAAHGQPQETGADLLQRILSERRARWEQKQLAKFAEQGKAPPKGWQTKYSEPAAPSSSNELSIPETWVWTGIEQLADGAPHALKAGPFGSALKKEFYTSTGYKVYGQEQVIRGDAYFGDYFIPEDKYQELISCATKPGDLLISLVGTTGRILVLPADAQPGIINPRLLKVSLSPGNIRPEYVQVVLQSPYARHFFKLNAHGGTMDVLNLGILKELAIPLPELAEQEEIVRKVNEEFEAIERQESAILFALRQSTAQRKNILKAAFSGQLVPQNANDEPASELLARIRTERAGATTATKRGRKAKETA